MGERRWRAVHLPLRGCHPGGALAHGATGFVIDNALYPLQPFELFPGQRLGSNLSSQSIWTRASAKGSYVAFVTYSCCNAVGDLHLVRADGASPSVKLGQRVSANSVDVQFNPDESRLLFLGDFDGTVGTLYSAATDGTGEPVPLATGVNPTFQQTADGSHVIFLVSATSTLELASTDGSGTPTQLGTGVATPSVTFTPDQSHFLFVSDASSGTGTLQLARSDGTGTPAQLGTGVGGFAFTPDGTHIIYYTGLTGATGTLTLAASSGSGTPVQLGSAVQSYKFITDQAGSSHIIYLANYANQVGTLKMANVDGSGTPRQLATNAEGLGTIYSGDPAHLYFTQQLSGASLNAVVNADGSGGAVTVGSLVQPTYLAYSPASYYQTFYMLGFAFLPDGKHVVYKDRGQSTAPVLYVASMDGLTAPVLLANWDTSSTPALASDGSRLAYAGPDAQGAQHLHIVGSDGSAIATLNVWAQVFQFTPDSSKLVYSSYSSSTGVTQTQAIAASGGGSPVTIWTGQSYSAVYGLEISPDNKRGAIYDTNSRLYLAPVDGSSSALALGGVQSGNFPQSTLFSADSQYLVYATGSKLMATRSDGSTAPVTLGQNTSSIKNDGTPFTVTPDGSHLMFLAAGTPQHALRLHLRRRDDHLPRRRGGERAAG